MGAFGGDDGFPSGRGDVDGRSSHRTMAAEEGEPLAAAARLCPGDGGVSVGRREAGDLYGGRRIGRRGGRAVPQQRRRVGHVARIVNHLVGHAEGVEERAEHVGRESGPLCVETLHHGHHVHGPPSPVGVGAFHCTWALPASRRTKPMR